MENPSAIAAIRANADLVASIARERLGQELSFDEQAVRWLDGYIQRQHEGGDPASRDGLINTLGSFLGECIIRNFGGEWACVDGSWCVRFDEKNGRAERGHSSISLTAGQSGKRSSRLGRPIAVTLIDGTRWHRPFSPR